jgi:hypothetical protein
MYDTLTQLQQDYLNGAFETEEDYQNAVLAAKEYYYEKLENYSNLHAVALTTDSRVINDAWSSDFSDITENTAKWQDETDKYAQKAAKSM